MDKKNLKEEFESLENLKKKFNQRLEKRFKKMIEKRKKRQTQIKNEFIEELLKFIENSDAT